MYRIKGIIFHWSASGPETTVDDIRRWHVKGNGWRDIGYHRVVLHELTVPNATHWGHLVKQGRDLDMDMFIEDFEIGAHARGFNREWVSVCVVGGPNHKLSPLQRQAVIETPKILTVRFGLELNDRTVKTHSEVNPTACPGPEIQNIIEAVRTGRAA